MSKYVLKTLSDTGELINEETLEIKEGSTLILQPTDNMDIETLWNIHNYIRKSLDNNANVVTIPYNFKIQVLERGEK